MCNHLLICVLFALLDVGDGLWPKPVGDLVGAQGDTKDVLVVTVLILESKKAKRDMAGEWMLINSDDSLDCKDAEKERS